MQFDVDRIAILAGLSGRGSSGLMKEGAPAAPAPAGRPAVAPAKPATMAAPSAPSKSAAPPGPKTPVEEESYLEEEEYGMHEMSADEMVYEINETDLMEALVDMREQRLEESRVRSAVRSELSSIINDMESGSRWIYGDRKPANSASGRVARGFMGPGFR